MAETDREPAASDRMMSEEEIARAKECAEGLFLKLGKIVPLEKISHELSDGEFRLSGFVRATEENSESLLRAGARELLLFRQTAIAALMEAVAECVEKAAEKTDDAAHILCKKNDVEYSLNEKGAVWKALGKEGDAEYFSNRRWYATEPSSFARIYDLLEEIEENFGVDVRGIVENHVQEAKLSLAVSKILSEPDMYMARLNLNLDAPDYRPSHALSDAGVDPGLDLPLGLETGRTPEKAVEGMFREAFPKLFTKPAKQMRMGR